MTCDQGPYEVRCEWGLRGAEILAPVCDAVVIVDVLSFTTSVSVAVDRGGRVFPYRWRDDGAPEFAEQRGAILAGRRGSPGYSLSPRSLMSVTPGEWIVLPSPNGSTISLSTGDTPTFAGSLRNASAVAAAASRCGRVVGIIPCGERWPDDTLRLAFEDLLGAGAVIRHLPGNRSPEAEAAVAAFEAAETRIATLLSGCGSGRELVEKGYAGDVELVAEIDADDVAPRLVAGAFAGE